MTRRTLFAAGFGLSIAVLSLTLRAQGDMSAGTWEMNVAKSSSTGALAKSQTRTWEVSGQSVKYTMKGADAQGKPLLVQYAAAYDGKDYPITGDAGSDTIALTRVDERNFRFTQKKAGRVVSTGTRVVSPDGRTVTVTSEGTNAAGQPTKAVLVFDRR
ncbi:MAG: hypothetical protein IT177_14235 [Acidobacteria bacterium]|nr:hypothetical protein [Acidobacteriota bacterium]